MIKLWQIRASHTLPLEREVEKEERTKAHLVANEVRIINENRKLIGRSKQ